MTVPLKDYRQYLEGLAEKKSNILFSNGGKEYASILMSVLFANTSQEAVIFCEGFGPELVSTEDYRDALNRYLDQGKGLKVLLNNTEHLDEDPIQLLLSEKNRRENPESIQIRAITPEGRQQIKDQFNGSVNNFAVFDSEKFRLEYDPAEYTAFGSFNRPEDAKLLRGLFDRVFESATQIDEHIA